MSCTLTIDGITVEAETLTAAKRALTKAKREAEKADAARSGDRDVADLHAFAIVGRIASGCFNSSCVFRPCGSGAGSFHELVRDTERGSDVGQIRGADNLTWCAFTDRVVAVAVDCGGWTFAAQTADRCWYAIGHHNGQTSAIAIKPTIVALSDLLRPFGSED